MVARNRRHKHLVNYEYTVPLQVLRISRTSEKLRLQIHRIEGVNDFIVVGFDLACLRTKKSARSFSGYQAARSVS